MGLDGGLWALIRDHIKGDWQRVESGAIGSGCPDLNFCIAGIEGWIETKLTDTYRVEFRAEQVGWIARRSRAGGRVFVMIRRKHNGGQRKGAPVDELWLFPGSLVEELHRDGFWHMDEKYRLGEGGPRNWDWSVVRSALVNPLPR